MFFDHNHFAARAAICAGQVPGTRWHPLGRWVETGRKAWPADNFGDALGVARAGFMEAGAPKRGPRF